MSEIEFEVAVRDADGQETERIKFAGSRLDDRVRSRLLKEAVVMYLANRRQGTHETKTRGKVSGSNRKPWRQKGTGRARSGSRKSPLWRGGGVVFGPHPRDYSYRINKKQRRLAVRSALFSKFRDGDVQVVDGIELEEPRTGRVSRLLRSLGIEGRVLIGTAGLDRNLWLSARNIPEVNVLPVAEFNALEVLSSRTVLLTRDALDRLLASREAGGAGGGD